MAVDLQRPSPSRSYVEASSVNLTAELVRGVRKRGRAWPRCDTRGVREPFDWCDEPAPWVLGEQHLCEICAAVLIFGKQPLGGIHPDGVWPGTPTGDDDE